MEANGFTDESLAELVRADGTPCDRSTINRLRNGKSWFSKRLASRLRSVSGGAISLDEVVDEAEARA